MSRDQVKDKNQRRSLKSDSNNNLNLKTPSPKTKTKVEMFKNDKPFEEVFTDSSGSSSVNGDYGDDYLENN